MEKLAFYVNKKIHYVDIIWTNNKNLYLKILDHKIVVSAPIGTKMQVVQTFVESHVVKFVKYLDTNIKLQTYDFNKQYLYLFGQKYHLKILTGFQFSMVEIINHNVYLKVKRTDERHLYETLYNFLVQKLYQYLQTQVPYYEQLISTKRHQLQVINKTSNWASNIIHKGLLSFSLKLVHFQKPTIDYVIIHELIHDFEPNHQVNFWKKVQTFCPDYKFHIQQLKTFL